MGAALPLGEGDLIRSLLSQAEEHVTVVAPFIKRGALERCLENVAPGVRIEVFTRWRPDEILSGVSDLSVWDYLRALPTATLWLNNSLHAKVYRSDSSCVVGSANVTGKALGWAASPNLELLVECPLHEARLDGFFELLALGAVQVDDELYERMKRVVDEYESLFPPRQVAEDPIPWDVGANSGGRQLPPMWIPMLRQPDDLYLAYVGDVDSVSSQGAISARADLEVIDIPLGLSRDAFNAAVAMSLLQMPVVAIVDRMLASGPQRFGAVTERLQLTLGLARDEAAVVWQALMRWLLYFLPDRYRRQVNHHTEMFQRMG